MAVHHHSTNSYIQVVSGRKLYSLDPRYSPEMAKLNPNKLCLPFLVLSSFQHYEVCALLCWFLKINFSVLSLFYSNCITYKWSKMHIRTYHSICSMGYLFTVNTVCVYECVCVCMCVQPCPHCPSSAPFNKAKDDQSVSSIWPLNRECMLSNYQSKYQYS